MRSYAVFVALLLLAGLLAVFQLTREPVEYTTTAAEAATPGGRAAEQGAEPDPAGTRAPKDPAKATTTKDPAKAGKDSARPTRSRGADPAKAPPAKPPMDRPLRVAALGWELLAPGVVANGGAVPGKESLFAARKLTVKMTGHETMAGVEAALARGGADPRGADVALLPLPSLVTSYERLRALRPEIFLVLGWSRGQTLYALQKATLVTPPRRRGQVGLLARPGHPSTFLALHLLDLAGVPPDKVRLVPAADRNAGKVPFAARPRGGTRGPRAALVSTADASQLIPVVAVAPKGFITSNLEALVSWGNVWMEGSKRMQRDVPGAARQVAALRGAPQALTLLQRLGQLEPLTLKDNTRLAALSGRSPVTLEGLFQRCWRVSRSAGLLTAPPPEAAPLSVAALSALVRTYPALVEAPVGGPPAPKAKTRASSVKGEYALLLRHSPRLRRWDQRLVAARLAELAVTFPAARLTLSVRKSMGRAKAALQMALDRYDLPRPERLTAVSRAAGPLVTLEIKLLR